MNITILGAGAWGTALAIVLSRCHSVVLWGRHATAIQAMDQQRENIFYLRGFDLPKSLILTAELADALEHIKASDKQLLIVAVPVSNLRIVLKQLCRYSIANLVWLCKGLEEPTHLLPHQIVRAILGDSLPIAALSGPSFAQEVARDLPCALTIASNNYTLCEHVVTAMHGSHIRIYPSTDLIGVGIGGAVKNILAIATGAVDGLQLGANARAALITQGLTEMTHLGVALGAQLETFMGLAGVGDLILTCTGDLSRNRRVGLSLAQGQKLDAIVAELGHVAEGIHCVKAVCALASDSGITMPIVNAVADMLFNNVPVRQALEPLWLRPA